MLLKKDLLKEKTNIEKALDYSVRTEELLKLPGVNIHPKGLRYTIMTNFCPAHYHIYVKGCVINEKTGKKDCIKCWCNFS